MRELWKDGNNQPKEHDMNDHKTPKALADLELKPSEIQEISGGKIYHQEVAGCDQCKYGSASLSASN
jgi:hypothetical protein